MRRTAQRRTNKSVTTRRGALAEKRRLRETLTEFGAELRKMKAAHTVQGEALDALRRQMLKSLMPNAAIKFEVSLADHCDLNCQGCDRFAPLAEPRFLDPDLFARDAERLSRLFCANTSCVTLGGGEALLHPETESFFSLARKAFPQGQIRLKTNGMALDGKGENFWRAAREHRIIILMTVYPGLRERYWNMFRKAMEQEVTLVARYIYDKPCFPALDMDGTLNAKQSFLECGYANDGIFLVQGRLYPCPVAAGIGFFNRHFGPLPLLGSDSISIYETGAQEILNFLASPIPFCRFCDVRKRRRGRAWEESRREISEWVE